MNSGILKIFQGRNNTFLFAQLMATILFVFVPLLALGAEGDSTIIPCGNKGQAECTWAHLYVLVRNFINFLLFYVALPLSAISIAVAGYYYILAAASESNKTKAKDILWGVLIGLGLALGAWLIVHFIIDTLVDPEVAKNFPTEQGTNP